MAAHFEANAKASVCRPLLAAAQIVTNCAPSATDAALALGICSAGQLNGYSASSNTTCEHLFSFVLHMTRRPAGTLPEAAPPPPTRLASAPFVSSFLLVLRVSPRRLSG